MQTWAASDVQTQMNEYPENSRRTQIALRLHVSARYDWRVQIQMLAIISPLSVLALSFLIVRIGTVALTMTGSSEEVASFQSLSAFSGAGFTTDEAESVLVTTARRRIVKLLIRLGRRRHRDGDLIADPLIRRRRTADVPSHGRPHRRSHDAHLAFGKQLVSKRTDAPHQSSVAAYHRARP